MNKSNENFLIVQKAINMNPDDSFRVLFDTDETLKPYAIINIDSINTQDEADIYVFHLTNHPNPVREVCALCLCDLINKENIEFFLTSKNILTLCDAICDINPNICRAVTDVFKNNPQIAKAAEPLIINNILMLLDDFKIYEKEFGAFCENKMKNRKNHAKNKKLFNLYWCLEALSEIIAHNCSCMDKISDIVRICSDFLDYTIREKAAKLLIKMPEPPYELLQKLKNDENFYVKNQVCDKICDDSDNRDII